jgi:hypothetical protein
MCNLYFEKGRRRTSSGTITEVTTKKTLTMLRSPMRWIHAQAVQVVHLMKMMKIMTFCFVIHALGRFAKDALQ